MTARRAADDNATTIPLCVASANQNIRRITKERSTTYDDSRKGANHSSFKKTATLPPCEQEESLAVCKFKRKDDQVW